MTINNYKNIELFEVSNLSADKAGFKPISFIKATFISKVNSLYINYVKRKGYNIDNQYSLYFLTFTTVGWIDIFTRKECKDIIIESLKYCIENKGLIINAYVLMESHLHMITRAEESSDGLSAIIRDFKKFTSKQIINWILKSGKESRKDWLKMVMKYHAKYNANNTNFQVWQQNNQPKECIQPKFTWQKINYIHDNPVRSKIVDNPEDYIHSSARNYLKNCNSILDITLLDLDINIGFIRP